MSNRMKPKGDAKVGEDTQRKKNDADIPLEFASEVNLNENESTFVTFIVQTRALLWKNFLVFSRKPTIFLFLLLTPVVIGKLLELIVGIGHSL